jgi:hypothetical protein
MAESGQAESRKRKAEITDRKLEIGNWKSHVADGKWQMAEIKIQSETPHVISYKLLFSVRLRADGGGDGAFTGTG